MNHHDTQENTTDELYALNQLNDICVICLSNLDQDDYILDCNHKYHTKCIIEWFRKGNSNCPLCNDSPFLQADDDNYYYANPMINERCSLIRRKFGRKNDCPPTLKKAIDKLRELETKQKEAENEYRTFVNDPIIKEYQGRGKQLRKETRKYHPKIRNQKIKIVTMMPGYFISN